MISVSSDYKQAMSKAKRDRAYISVGIGIINQNAQESGTLDADLSYWSHGNVFDSNQGNIEYATLEENYFRADGTMYFMPENEDLAQFLNNGIATSDFLQPIRIDFPQIYAIKGITLEFGSAYPTEFTIETAEKTLNYTNDANKFVTQDVLGDTNYIVITPISMVGGQQRFRLQSILMGVGLQYSNAQTKDLTITEFVSSISDELPNEDMTFTFYDEENRFNVDDDNSFIDFLETMQKVTLSFGITLENGTVEWNQIATMYLKDWKSQKGIVSLTATDRLEQMEDEYSLANRIYDRTAYDEAESIFSDAGLQPDEYYIDEYLRDVPLHNPMPQGTHKECLQLLANACRCIIRQDENGVIQIRANFANVIDPTEISVTDNGVASWSKPQNVLIGTDVVYADMTQDFFKADGSMYFLPEDENYLETSYVSEQISNEFGDFDANLLPYPYAHTTITNRGVTFTDNGDGSVSVSGTATGGSSYFQLCGYNESTRSKILNLPPGRYEFDINTTDSENIYIGCDKRLISDCSYIGRYMNSMKSPSSVTIPESDIGTYFPAFLICVPNGKTANGICYPMLTKIEEDGSYPTEYQPYQENPKLTISMPAAYTYFGLNMKFDGNPPKEMIIHTYNSGEEVATRKYTDMSNNTTIIDEFKSFDTMVFEFTKGYPNNRVLVNQITFGDLSDYVLTKSDMMSQPIGYKEKKVKAVRCKIFTFENDAEGNPKEIEDSVFAIKVLNEVGEIKTINNPLISTQTHAELLAEWIGNYYANNISYEVDYRGDPRNNAADIIHMESDVLSNMQVEITKHTLKYNGAFSGSMELRRALKIMGG